jgi:hypothetical protein
MTSLYKVTYSCIATYVQGNHICVNAITVLLITRGGQAQLFLSSQWQFRNMKKALPQSQFRNFLKKCCFATAIFYEVRNFKSATWEL